ncbi:hypothetical protein [Dactylosporangium sp. NPDC050588]|uniref:hypothetical protein n=1 Tax=Dactylosporangium sp. NPDC050588 TaxID=3157211 RepID=UPI0033CFC10C
MNSQTVNDNEAGDWLEWAYGHGFGDTFDAVAYHPYPDLFRGSALFSGCGRFTLWLQGDGNLVMHDRGVPYWVRGGHKGYRLTSQHDGNLVLYDHADRPLWASGTSGRGDATLWMQEDGNLVLYPHAGGSAWASGTVRP